MKVLATAAAVLAFAVPGAALADVVVYHQSGTSNFIWFEGLLPGAGEYKFELTSTIPTTNFFLMTGWTYHWDEFIGPPPKPHNQNITGNDFDETFFPDLSTGAALFTVPETEYTFFLSPQSYQNLYGIPVGTSLYREDKYETPWFQLVGGNGQDFDFDFKITKLGAGNGGGGAVPEPGAWALMILGFGAVGATLRRRRSAPLAA